MRILFVYLFLVCSVATADTWLIKSIDGGRTWIDIDSGPPDQFLTWFSVDPNSSALYAVTRLDNPNTNPLTEQHLRVSHDGGQTWQVQQTFVPDKASWFSPIATPAGPDTLYLAYQEYHPYPESLIVTRVWNNGQQSEQYPAAGLSIVPQPPIDAFGGGFTTGFAADPAVPSRLYALITDDDDGDFYVYFEALWTSEDGGRDWSLLAPPLTARCGYPLMWTGPGSSVYLTCSAGDSGEFWKSGDAGATWTQQAEPEGQRVWDL